MAYRNQEFFRVGYYVHNEYADPALLENPPEQLQIDKVVRRILSDKPRITRMAITWTDVAPAVENIPLSNMMEVEDPFAKSNGAFEKLEQLNADQQQPYSYGMFSNGGVPTEPKPPGQW
ncbi:MAG: hypothetical protein JST59_01205 [Actinobacteria bacterium]|nr:hypothetical protein [Actinomycetota bacterium]